MSRNYLEALVVIIAAAAFGFFLVWPKYSSLAEVTQKIQDKAAEIKNRQDYFAGLEKTASELDLYPDTMQKIATALPDGTDSPATMNFIQSAAIQSQLILKRIDYTGAEKDSNGGMQKKADDSQSMVQSYTIDATLTGTYADFKSFLSRIESSSRVINTEELNLAPAPAENADEETAQKKGKNGEPVYNFKIRFSLHYY